jgi:hypothetical protein
VIPFTRHYLQHFFDFLAVFFLATFRATFFFAGFFAFFFAIFVAPFKKVPVDGTSNPAPEPHWSEAYRSRLLRTSRLRGDADYVNII